MISIRHIAAIAVLCSLPALGLAQAENKMSSQEIEEIRKIAYGLDLTHREFINAKLKVLGRDQPG